VQGYENIVNRWYTNYDGARQEQYGDSLRQETGRDRYWRQIEEIRTEHGISHSEARGRWSQYYTKGGARIKPIKKLVLAVKASTAKKTTCPFCRDSIYHPDEGGPDYVCTNCQAHYHLDCFEDELGGRCATLGCSTRRVIENARIRIRTRGVRTVTPETPITHARDDGATVEELDPDDYRTQQDLLRRLAEQRREQVAEDRRWADEEAERAQEARERRQEAAEAAQRAREAEEAERPEWRFLGLDRDAFTILLPFLIGGGSILLIVVVLALIRALS